MEAVDVNAGRAVSALGGTEEGLMLPGAARVPLGFDCISPLAVAILFVKDEIAQPAHDVSFWSVPIRGTAPLTAPVLGGGKTVSGSVPAYFRIRCVYTSNVLLAWSRMSLKLLTNLFTVESTQGPEDLLLLINQRWTQQR